MNEKLLIDRAALEQTQVEQEPVSKSDNYLNGYCAGRTDLLREQTVEQKPVAWIENIGGGIGYNPYHDAARKLPDGVRFDLYTHPQNLNCKSNQARLATLWGYEKPQPPRQPLTDEQITDLWIKHARSGAYIHTFAQAIERFHGIGS